LVISTHFNRKSYIFYCASTATKQRHSKTPEGQEQRYSGIPESSGVCQCDNAASLNRWLWNPRRYMYERICRIRIPKGGRLQRQAMNNRKLPWQKKYARPLHFVAVPHFSCCPSRQPLLCPNWCYIKGGQTFVGTRDIGEGGGEGPGAMWMGRAGRNVIRWLVAFAFPVAHPRKPFPSCRKPQWKKSFI